MKLIYNNMSAMWTALILIVSVAAPVVTEEQARRYTGENFEQNIRELQGNFIMFYAPWCSHCRVFEPTWHQLADLVNSPDTTIAIAQVDCTTEVNLCRENDITGYPTLLYYKQNSFHPSEYRGTRDLNSLTLFLNEAMVATNEIPSGDTGAENVKIYEGMAYLTDRNFDKFVSSGQHFIMFYVPWCSVSQTQAPTWSTLAQQYKQNASVQISKIDCMEHHATCLNFDIKDYPHLIWMVNGKVMEAITGLQTLDGLREFVERMARPENHNPDRFMKKKKSLPVARISEDTFDLYMQKKLVFINYYAAWCAHCKLMVPTWLELGRLFQDDSRIIIGEVDCAQEDTLCVQEDVYQFPTLILYENSKVIFQHRGSTTLENLLQEVKKHLVQNTEAEIQPKEKDEL